MATSTSRTFESRTSAPDRSLDARHQSLIMAVKSGAASRQHLAVFEAAARIAPITGVADSYDPVTGDWLIKTPSGGILRAGSLTNGALVGRRIPVQRFGDSQSSAVDAPPSDSGQTGRIVTEMESLQRDLWERLAPEERTIGIQGPAIQQYPVVAANDAPRLYLGLSTLNRNNDGTEASAGLADVLVNGEIAVPGTTEIPVDAYVALNVTDVGTGDIMAVSVYARLI